MSIDEARQQKALALLEYEEAKESYDALRQEAEALGARLALISSFASAMRRQNEGFGRDAAQHRKKIEAEASHHRAAMDYDALMALDDRLLDAEARLKTAAEIKKTFGMKV